MLISNLDSYVELGSAKWKHSTDPDLQPNLKGSRIPVRQNLINSESGVQPIVHKTVASGFLGTRTSNLQDCWRLFSYWNMDPFLGIRLYSKCILARFWLC
ncbi:hypothetical protein CEXT_455471 [Caerostris extrusa]|uniref:Uncharacterized protein n=1 Tax=Caerostris extrusa TaxID=172846 RepID=A0AAV4U489_CAEEX|nr:hypothetical protein CEXT_455471 [Caerostris extrusa]